MRKLLNTIYITDADVYLSLNGENIVCKKNDDTILRIPFDNVENLVCFNYQGCSPALMGKCVEKNIPINFLSPQGKFLAKVCGETKGNVFLRVAQIDTIREHSINLIRNTMLSKFSNSRKVIKRSIHDNPSLKENTDIIKALDTIGDSIEKIRSVDDPEIILGIEGNCAERYFSTFKYMIKGNTELTNFSRRTKRPPLDPVNAMLSYIYTLLTCECASALETVGLDSYIGFYHKLRSGRSSLACDLVEELRCIAERFVITMFNLKIVNDKDFTKEISGAVYLNDSGRKKVLTRWQEKKRTTIVHPYLNQKIPYGLLPYVQSNLLAKYMRGDIEEYPPFLLK